MADLSKKGIMKSALDKVKLVDAGVKNKYGYGPDSLKTSAPENPADKIYYPSLHLDTKEAPILSGMDVGTEVTLLVKACVTSHSLRESSDKKTEDFSLDIKQIGVVSTGKSDTKY